MFVRRGVVLGAVAVLVAACGGAPPADAPAESPTTAPPAVVAPSVVEGDLPAADLRGTQIPYQFEELTAVTVPWDGAPQERDGVFVGTQTTGQQVTFTAVTHQGTALWEVSRPQQCGQFTLTTVDDMPLAVLCTTTEDGFVAHGIDASTGDVVWGPTAVPGPLTGPGVVFTVQGTPAPGDVSDTVALRADTGEVVSWPQSLPDDAHVIGEKDGLILTVHNGTLEAWDSQTGERSWSIPAPHGAQQVGDSPLGQRFVEVVGESTSVVVDARDGDVVASDVITAGTDPSTGTLVVLDDESTSGVDESGATLWSIPRELPLGSGDTSSQAPPQITAAGGVMVYVREGALIRAHNALTGDVAEAYPPGGNGTILVPVTMSATGAGVLTDYDTYTLVTTLHEP